MHNEFTLKLSEAMSNYFARYQRMAVQARRRKDLYTLAAVLSAVVILFGTLDVLSTNIALSLGAYEINPMVRQWQGTLGEMWYLPKMLLHGLVVAMLLWAPNRTVIWLILLSVYVNASVVFNNFQVIETLM